MSYDKARSLLDKGISKPTLYSVQLPGNRISREKNEHLDMFCISAAIPEVRLETSVISGHEFHGIERDQPTKLVFGKPFSIRIIERSDFGLYKSMREWFETTTVQANQGSRDGRATGNRSHRMRYYNSYVEDMSLTKLEYASGLRVGNGQAVGYRQVLKVNFINAYPKAIQAVNFSADAYNQLTTFQVDFSYESYNVQTQGLVNEEVPRDIADFLASQG